VLGALKTRLGFDNKYAFYPCEVCHKAKQTREPFPLSDHKSLDVGELVHLDLWGPYKVTSAEGHKTPSSVLAGKSPFFLVYGHEASLSHIRVFGCLCFASILNNFDKFSIFENPIHSERPDDEGRVTSDSDGTESLSSEEDQGNFRATSMEENTPLRASMKAIIVSPMRLM
ncbi:hypothetical protein Tco_0813127, partial [Tanacetum coccineum]